MPLLFPECRQGADFVHLYRRHGVRVQTGGSDQWGNITAGATLSFSQDSL